MKNLFDYFKFSSKFISKMPFTELYSTVINQKDFYVKKVKVLLCTGDGGKERTYWVDIRYHYNSEDVCKPNKFGVCITVDELKKLLPNMMLSETAMRIASGEGFGLQRATRNSYTI